jgi:hypothetical protein
LATFLKDIISQRLGVKMKTIVIIVLILLFVSISGCTYVDIFADAGKTVISTGQSTQNQLCKLNCDNNVKDENLPLGCPPCPKPTTQVPVNTTPTTTGK